MTEKNTKNEGKKVYEVGYLLLSNIEESKVVDESNKVRDIIEKNGGIFLSEGTPEMKALTYPMTKEIAGKKQKFDNAYFGWIKFEGTSDMITKIKEELDNFENILRFLLIITIKEDFKPISATTKKKKPAKFSFGGSEDKKDDTEEVKEGEGDKESKETEEPKQEEKDELTDEEKKKKLDDTIDNLVIE